MKVIIGVDPHKTSHTAVAIGQGEVELARVRVCSTRQQVKQLLDWAEPFERRRWAIESAGGLGYLLAQQLVAVGEDVVDVPATLASRVRVLASGRSAKNDPNDALSVAVAALRAPTLRSVVTADHAEVRAFWPNATLTSATTGPASCAGCMPHWPSSHRAESPRNSTLLTPRASSPASARRRRWSARATSSPWSCSKTSAASMCNSRIPTAASAKRFGRQAPRSPRCSASAPSSPAWPSDTPATSVASPTATATPRTTGVRRSSSPPAAGPCTGCQKGGNRQLNHAIHIAAICQIRQSHSDGRAYFDRKVAEGKTKKEALR